MKKFLLHIILSVCSILAFSQNSQQSLEFADFQFEIQNYELALRSYKRVLFFDEGKLNEVIQPKISICYFKINDFDRALFHYNLAYTYASNDSLSNEYLLARVLIFILQEKYNFALQELYSITDSLSPYFYKKIEFYHGVIAFQNNNFQQAEWHFINSLGEENIKQKQAVNDLFDSYKFNKPNPKVAKTLSLFIPGAGQLYAGDVKNALNSFILTGVFAVLFVLVGKNYSLIDGVVSVLPWFQRYYAGGYTKAGRIAEQKLEEKKQHMYQQLLLIFFQNN